MKKQKIVITFLAIMIVTIVLVFLTARLKTSGRKSNENYNETSNLQEEQNEEKNVQQQNNDFTKYKLTKLNDPNLLSSINFCMNIYKRYSSNIEESNSSENKENLLSFIPDNIIKNIGTNINDYILSTKDEYRIDKIYSAIQETDDKPSENTYTYYLSQDTTLYLLKITRYDSSKNNLINNTLGIMIDSYNGYFWIIPYKYFEKNNIEIENEASINILGKNSNLKKSNLNKLSSDNNNNEQNICKIYYDNFIFNIKHDINKAYQNLDNKYKTNGYDENAYLNFIKQRNLDNGIMTNSSINITNDNKYLYQIIDEKNNIIVFTSGNVLEYKITYGN